MCPKHPGHCYACQPKPADTGQLCRTCTNHIRTALHLIPALITQLNQRDGKIDNHNETIRLKPVFGYRTPSPAFHLADDTCRLIHTWVDTTTDHTNTLGPPRYNITGIPEPYKAITDLCQWLNQHLTWAAQHQPKDIYNEITQTRRTLEKALSLDHHIERIPEPCPSCGTGKLTREDGSENICCDNNTCRRIWRKAEWLARVGTHT